MIIKYNDTLRKLHCNCPKNEWHRVSVKSASYQALKLQLRAQPTKTYSRSLFKNGVTALSCYEHSQYTHFLINDTKKM